MDRRRPLRRARADRRRGARLRRSALLALQVLRAAHGHRPSPGRVRRALAPYKVRPSPRGRSAAASRPVRRRSSCSPASGPRSPTSTPSAGWPRCATMSASSPRASLPGCPTRPALRRTPASTGACRPSSSPSRASTPRRPQAASWSAGSGLAAGNWYCVGLADRLPPASIRIGLIHYNTAGEVDRLLDELAALA